MSSALVGCGGLDAGIKGVESESESVMVVGNGVLEGDAVVDDEDARGVSESLVMEVEVNGVVDDVAVDDDAVADDDAIAEDEDATPGITSGGSTEFCPSLLCIVSTMSSG